jgi:hypothetical protein
MAAGLGFKTFTTGEVLTAGDVNGYLMQGVLVFASAAARDAAITSPQEGQFAFTKDTNGLWYYDGAAWVASGATGDIEGVTAGVGISGGGTSGTVTITNSMATAIDAKGDLVAGTGADTFAKLTVGANNTVLTADSAEATGLKWAAVSGGAGNMVQIATGTLSGASVVISSLSSYTDILIRITGVTNSTANGTFFMRLNATATDHNTFAFRSNGSTFSTFDAPADSDFYLTGDQMNRTNTDNLFAAKLTNCKNAGFTDYDVSSVYERGGGGTGILNGKGVYTKSEAVSSITFRNAGGNFAGGTYYVWGA